MNKLILITLLLVKGLSAEVHNIKEIHATSSTTDSSLTVPKCASVAPQNRAVYSITMHQSDPKHGTAVQSADLTAFLRMLQNPKSNLEIVSFPFFNLEEVVFKLSPTVGSTNADKELSTILESLPGTVKELGTLKVSIQCEKETPNSLLSHNTEKELPVEEKLTHEGILSGKFTSVPDCFNAESQGVYRIWKAANFSPAQAKSFSLLMNEINQSPLKLMTAPRLENITSHTSIIPWMRFEVKAAKSDLKLLENLKKLGVRLSCATSHSMPQTK